MATPIQSSYLQQLQALGVPPRSERQAAGKDFDDDPSSCDIRLYLSATDECNVIFKLSADLQLVLGGPDANAEAMVHLLDNAIAVLYEGVSTASVGVFQAAGNIVAKVTLGTHLMNGYKTLAYLQEHLPEFPVPKLHGVIDLGRYRVLFTSFVPGIDLEEAWPQLDDTQKQGVSIQLNTLWFQLRALPFQGGKPLGSVDGTGCMDVRRRIRRNSEPIVSVDEFQDFMFSGAYQHISKTYKLFVRSLLPNSSANKIVFTHDDLRPAIIMVSKGEDGTWAVATIVDWESSGFYPDYWELVKMTNTLIQDDDWFNYLPESISPSAYPISWLVDWLWGHSLIHN